MSSRIGRRITGEYERTLNSTPVLQTTAAALRHVRTLTFTDCVEGAIYEIKGSVELGNALAGQASNIEIRGNETPIMDAEFTPKIAGKYAPFIFLSPAFVAAASTISIKVYLSRVALGTALMRRLETTLRRVF